VLRRFFNNEEKMKLLCVQTSLLFSTALACSSGWAQITNLTGEKLPFSVSVSVSEPKINTPAPTVIISHGGSCLTSNEPAWARQIIQWGYNAIVIDHCKDRGIGPHTGEEPPPLTPLQRVNDYVYTAEWIKKQDWHKGKVVLMGFSRGGEAVLRAADPRLTYNIYREAEGLAMFDAYVAYYPACSRLPEAPRAPLLIHHGEADNLASFRQCEYQRMTHENYQIKTYPGVHHGFDSPGIQITGSNKYIGRFIARSYDPSADQTSRLATQEFLKKIFSEK
jgi:dienelactone hydrolase